MLRPRMARPRTTWIRGPWLRNAPAEPRPDGTEPDRTQPGGTQPGVASADPAALRSWTARYWPARPVASRPWAADRGRAGSIRLRLALAFVAVALSALALLAGLIAIFAAADVANQASRQQDQLTQAMTTVAGATWDASSSWARADLVPLLAAARRIGAGIEITDVGGRVVAASPGFAHDARPAQTARVMINGRFVGTIQVRLTGTGLAATDTVLREALWRAIAGAAALTALLAVLAALVMSRRITDPVARLIEVAQATGHGDRDARVGQIRAPAELRDLAATFDRMADNLARQDQLRRDMAADVAHELRTPVAVLQAGHEALIDGVVQPTPRQLSSLRDEVLRLVRLVDDLYTLSSAEAAALQLSLAKCDLAEITATAAGGLASRFDAASIMLEQRLTPVTIMADQGRVHQVVLNLLGNALKFTPAGGQVTVETSAAGPQAQLSVTDTGRGIPVDELPRVFNRFWRGRQSGLVAGSGIGLAIVAELVRGHGGSVQVTSTPGQGTRVVVTFPQPLTGPPSRQAGPGGRSGRSGRSGLRWVSSAD
jgi:two-component system, OmpR family, sensor histidine kinase BaeS